MKKRIDELFSSVKGGRALLISFATFGFPDPGGSRDIMLAMLESGTDILEVGIPFSDPVMDGPVIQESSHRALEAGATVAGALDMAGELRGSTENPILIMTSYNLIYRHGLDRFAEEAGERGVDGVLIPDVPVEEVGPWKEAAGENGVATILFASMNASDRRIREAGELTEGFLYCFAVLGTTGMREKISASLGKFLKRASALVDCPLAAGLGISTPDQCRTVGEMAQGVIIGSAYMNAVLEGAGPREISEMARGFSRALRSSG